MVTITELQAELFSKEMPPFEMLKSYSAIVNSSERNRIAVSQKAKEQGANHLGAGIALWLCGQLKQAEEILTKAKDCAQKFLVLGCVYRKQGYFDKAIEQFELAGKQRAESLTVAMEKIETLRQAEMYEQAQKELKACSNFQNVSAEYHYQLARVQEALGCYPEAAKQYQAAIDIDSAHARAIFHLAYMHDLRGDETQAIELYKQAASLYPAYTAALLNLAVLYEERGEYAKAMRCVNSVLMAHPNHPRATLFEKDIESSRTMVYDEEREKRKDRQNKILEIPISDFELSVRSRNCLKKMNISTLGDLLRTTEAELLAYKNFGETSLMEIKKILDSKNLHLGMAIEDNYAGSVLPPPESEDNEDEEDDDDVNPELLNKPVEDLELSVRAKRALSKLNIRTFHDLVIKTEAELLGCKNFGVTSLNEIKEKLNNFGLTLRKLD